MLNNFVKQQTLVWRSMKPAAVSEEQRAPEKTLTLLTGPLIVEWRKQLQACVKAQGQHFKHFL